MQRTFKSFITIPAAAAVLLLAANANAQSITETAQDADADVLVNMTMTLQSGITLTVTGSTDDDASASTALSGTSGDTGTIDFGDVTTLTGTPGNGERVRNTAGDAGSFFVGTLSASLEVTGIPSVDLTIERDATDSGNFAADQLRFASGDTTDWSGASFDTVGTAVTATPANVATSLADAGSAEFQIAAFLKDTDAAGAYSAAVLLTATPTP